MNNNFEQFPKPEKNKREMGTEEVEELGAEMEDYLTSMLNRKEEIMQELETSKDEENTAQLEEELRIIEEQLALDQEGLEGFIEDIKSGDYSDPTITED